MKLFSRLFFIAITAIIVACGTDPGGRRPPAEETDGTVGLELVVGPYTINTVHYEIVGTNGFHASGDINVSMSSAISGFVGSIPAGTGYSITLTATAASNPNVSCTGTATFAVMSGATTVVNVALTCRNINNNGGILINGTVNLCPMIDVFDASPLNAAVGSSIALHAAATDFDTLPTPLTFNWAAPGFTASNANASFPCAAAGNYPLTLTVSDGDSSCDCDGHRHVDLFLKFPVRAPAPRSPVHSSRSFSAPGLSRPRRRVAGVLRIEEAGRRAEEGRIRPP